MQSKTVQLDRAFFEKHPNAPFQRFPGEGDWDFYQRSPLPMALDTNARIRACLAPMLREKREKLMKLLSSKKPENVTGAMFESLLFGALGTIPDATCEMIPEGPSPTPDIQFQLGGLTYGVEATAFNSSESEHDYRMGYEMDCVAEELGIRNLAVDVSVCPDDALTEQIPRKEIRQIVVKIKDFADRHPPQPYSYPRESLKYTLSNGQTLKLRLIPMSDSWHGLWGMGGGTTFVWGEKVSSFSKRLGKTVARKKGQLGGKSILAVWDRTFTGRPGIDSNDEEQIEHAVWGKDGGVRGYPDQVWIIRELYEHITNRTKVKAITKPGLVLPWGALDIDKAFHSLTTPKQQERWSMH